MHDEQYKRYQRACSEPIDCLFSIRKKKMYHFLIAGSGATNYKVTIGPKYISCSCPDYKNNAKELEIVCKHCIYVLDSVLKLFPETHSFWDRRFFTPDEFISIGKSYKENKVKIKNKEKSKKK
jgi:hypothetical protein